MAEIIGCLIIGLFLKREIKDYYKTLTKYNVYVIISLSNKEKKGNKMKLEFKNKDFTKVDKIESGTLVTYGAPDEIYGYGIVLKNNDMEHPVIYDMECDCYFEDIENYVIHRTFDKNSIKIVIE